MKYDSTPTIYKSARRPLSIVVPTLNEAGNIKPLLQRIDSTLKSGGMPYEVLFVDDNSNDDTQARIKELAGKYPVRLSLKKGNRGKAFSLLQGFEECRYETICMIDADLQYPPEAIKPMLSLISKGYADVVVTRRIQAKTSLARQLFSKAFNFLFIRMLFKIRYDTQSGLKVFNKHVLNGMSLKPTPWSFDLEFIVRALENNHTVLSHDITFESRTVGEPKVNLVKTSVELAKASVSLWRRSSIKHVRNGYDRSLHLSRNVLLPSFIILSFCLVPAQTATALDVEGVVQQTLNTLLNFDSERANPEVVPTDEIPAPVLTNPAQEPTAQSAPELQTPLAAQSTETNQSEAIPSQTIQNANQLSNEPTGAGRSYAYPPTKLSAATTAGYINLSKNLLLSGMLLITISAALFVVRNAVRATKHSFNRGKIHNA